MPRQVILKTIAFVVILLVVDRILYALLDAGFKRTEVGETGGMINRVLKVEADAVVLGSSRAWRHYDSSVLADALGISVYNAGCDGEGLPYVRGLADLLLSEYHPKLLIINIDEPDILSNPGEYDRVAHLAPFMGDSKVIREMIYRRGMFEPLKYLSRSFRYNGQTLAILKNLGVRNPRANGFNPLDKRLDTTSVAQQGAEDEPRSGAVPRPVDPYLCNLLTDTIRSAKAAGVEVVLASSPRWQPDFKTKPAYQPLSKQIAELAAAQNVPYITITIENEPVFRDPALFADAAHLNRQGARVFTSLLARRLVALRSSDSAGRSRFASTCPTRLDTLSPVDSTDPGDNRPADRPARSDIKG